MGCSEWPNRKFEYKFHFCVEDIGTNNRHISSIVITLNKKCPQSLTIPTRSLCYFTQILNFWIFFRYQWTCEILNVPVHDIATRFIPCLSDRFIFDCSQYLPNFGNIVIIISRTQLENSEICNWLCSAIAEKNFFFGLDFHTTVCFSYKQRRDIINKSKSSC